LALGINATAGALHVGVTSHVGSRSVRTRFCAVGLRGGIMTGMTTRQDELSESVQSRRARLAPADVGLAAARNGRRVTGLRREELAMLAGVSPDYYAGRTQVRAANVSDQVLDAVAAALRLDDLERRHLTDLVKPRANASAEDSLRVRPALRALDEELDPTPAVLPGPRLEVLVINGAGAALIDDFA